MCGIVGYIGSGSGNELVITGLDRLEYRGYDSCGIGMVSDNNIEIFKSINRVEDLKKHISKKSDITLGHTRWATHGGISLENSHPHMNLNKSIILVHNGVIENFEQLKEKYCSDTKLISQTDSEILVYVLEKLLKITDEIPKAIEEFKKEVDGSYAIIVYFKEYDKLCAIKNKSPLLIGIEKDFYSMSSDIRAVLGKVENFYSLQDGEYVIFEKNKKCILYSQDNKVQNIEYKKIDSKYTEIDKLEYNSYLEKEIEEQPTVLRRIISNYKKNGIDNNLKETIKNSNKIYIVACGTSYNAGLIGHEYFEKHLNIETEVVIASEYAYSKKIIDKNSLFLFLSQSGETADSMAVFKQVKNKYPILAITNTPNSQMDREADYALNLYAEDEISVASTKAYTSQVAVLSILIQEVLGNTKIYDDINKIITHQEKVISKKSEFKKLAKKMSKYKEIFYLGRLRDYNMAQEAALKIKEISYINVNAYASGELKHGPISLLDETKLVIFLLSDEHIVKNSRSNIEEAKARKANLITIASSKIANQSDDYSIEYDGLEELYPLVGIIVHQYLALYIAEDLNLDVDKPRNLAKAVTVE